MATAWVPRVAAGAMRQRTEIVRIRNEISREVPIALIAAIEQDGIFLIMSLQHIVAQELLPCVIDPAG